MQSLTRNKKERKDLNKVHFLVYQRYATLGLPDGGRINLQVNVLRGGHRGQIFTAVHVSRMFN